jgi:solute carrier family 50 protein (sugar transporter)
MAYEIFSQWVAPVIGAIIAFSLAASPWRALKNCEHDGGLREFNPLPTAVFLMNSIAWLFYAAMINSSVLVVLKAVLVLVNLKLTLVAYRFASVDVRDNIDAIVIWSTALLVVFAMLFYFLEHTDILSLVFGYSCMIWNLLVFVAPFSTLRKVIRTSDASPIYIPFAIIGCIGCSFWCIYGFAINQVPLIVPNAIGVLLNVLQIAVSLYVNRFSSTLLRGATAAGNHIVVSTTAFSVHTIENNENTLELR